MMSDLFLIALTPAALIFGALVGTWRLRLDPRDGLGLRLPSLRHALILGGAFIVLLGAHEWLYQLWDLGERQSDWRGKYSPAALALRIAFVALIYPFAEELFFRGFLFGLLRRKAGVAVAIIVPAIFFTLLHGLSSVAGILLILMDGLFFGFVRWRSGSLLLPIAFHIIGNTIAVAQRLS